MRQILFLSLLLLASVVAKVPLLGDVRVIEEETGKPIFGWDRICNTENQELEEFLWACKDTYQTTRYVYDEQGRLIAREGDNASTMHYLYGDDDNQPQALELGYSDSVDSPFSSQAQRSSIPFPEAPFQASAADSYTYDYDSADLLLTVTKPDTHTLNYVYDEEKKLKALTSSDSTIDYRYYYDAEGLLAIIEDRILGSVTLRSYDEAGHVATEVLANGLTVECSYDAAGRCLQACSEDSSLTIDYIDHHLSTAIWRDSKGSSLYQCRCAGYNAEGKPNHIVLNGELAKPFSLIPEEGMEEWRLKYDSNGNVIRIAKENRECKLNYDALNRLTSLIIDDVFKVMQKYDPFDRLLERSTFLLKKGLWQQDTGELFLYEDVDTVTIINAITKKVSTPLENPYNSSQTKNLHEFFYWLHQHLHYNVPPLSQLQDKPSLWNSFKETLDECLESVLPSFYLQLSGYYQHDVESHTFGDKEISPYVRVTLINGMGNIRQDLLETLKLISATHGDVKVHYVFHPTSGWTHDLLYCAATKFGYISPYARHLAAVWQSLLSSMGDQGHIYHYAHSIGGADTYAAIRLMTPEQQQRIRITTIGSATFIDTGNLESAANYSSRNDGVSLIFGYLTSFLNQDDNVYYIGSPGLPPLCDHTLNSSGTYGSLLKDLGAQFLEYIEELSNNSLKS